jgi:hypothetical protein
MMVIIQTAAVHQMLTNVGNNKPLKGCVYANMKLHLSTTLLTKGDLAKSYVLLMSIPGKIPCCSAVWSFQKRLCLVVILLPKATAGIAAPVPWLPGAPPWSRSSASVYVPSARGWHLFAAVYGFGQTEFHNQAGKS